MSEILPTVTNHFFFGAQVLALFTNESSKHHFVHKLMQVKTCDAASPLVTQGRALGLSTYVSRGMTLLSGFTVLENISLPLIYQGHFTSQEIVRRTHLLCKFGGIGPSLLERDAGDLNLLEKIQACFLQAAVSEPDLLVFDAVFESLAPCDQERVANLMASYRRLYPLRCILFLAYATPPVHLYAPTSAIDERCI